IESRASEARASPSVPCVGTTHDASACSCRDRCMKPTTGFTRPLVYVREAPTRKPTPRFHIRYVTCICGVSPSLYPAKWTCSGVDASLRPPAVVISTPSERSERENAAPPPGGEGPPPEQGG